MDILTGLLILFTAGFIVSQSYLAIRHKEPPKQEPQQQVIIQQDQDRSKPPEISKEAKPEDKENLPQDQKPKNPGQ
jgi:hypothetical protein